MRRIGDTQEFCLLVFSLRRVDLARIQYGLSFALRLSLVFGQNGTALGLVLASSVLGEIISYRIWEVIFKYLRVFITIQFLIFGGKYFLNKS